MGTSAPPAVNEIERKGVVVTEDEVRKGMAYAAQREEERRDLLSQVDDIDQDENEIIFEDTSPRRPMGIIYSMQNGEPLVMTRKRIRVLIDRRLRDGTHMFTANPTKAPEYRKGSEKCFLHKDSVERKQLDALANIASCPAGQLASPFAKHVHETVKHVKTWSIWEKYIEDKKEAAAIERQDRMYEATMAQTESIMELAKANNVTPTQAEQSIKACASCNEPITGKLADHVCS